MQLDLINLLNNDNVSTKEKLLLILASSDEDEMEVREIRELALSSGLRGTFTRNISSYLSRMQGLVVRLPTGWKITKQGMEHLRELGLLSTRPTANQQTTLRQTAQDVISTETRLFIEEAIVALEYDLFRAAVVLSWVGAVSILYQEVLKNHLVVFNTEAQRRNSKWKPAKNEDDLAKMKEYDFLQILAAISVIGKNTKQELEQCLKLRNACGHPNSLIIGEHRVASHLEVLILNVYKKFVI